MLFQVISLHTKMHKTQKNANSNTDRSFMIVAATGMTIFCVIIIIVVAFYIQCDWIDMVAIDTI